MPAEDARSRGADRREAQRKRVIQAEETRDTAVKVLKRAAEGKPVTKNQLEAARTILEHVYERDY